jgi:hypothetical protein
MPRIYLKDASGNKAPWLITRTTKLPRDWEGSCSHPQRTIQLKKSLSGGYLAAIAIHEALHAAFPDLDEAAIERGEDTVCRVLNALDILSDKSVRH